jgi:hypothetical protein
MFVFPPCLTFRVFLIQADVMVFGFFVSVWDLFFVWLLSRLLQRCRPHPQSGMKFTNKELGLAQLPCRSHANIQTGNSYIPSQTTQNLTMPPKTRSSDTGLQRIIQEVDDLQLPESAKGYFTEVSQSVFVMTPESDVLQLLKHIDARDQQWAKVVKLWEHYESHSKSFNKAMIEIMQNMQEIFLKDDAFLKQLYKERMEEVGATSKDGSV